MRKIEKLLPRQEHSVRLPLVVLSLLLQVFSGRRPPNNQRHPFSVRLIPIQQIQVSVPLARLPPSQLPPIQILCLVGQAPLARHNHNHNRLMRSVQQGRSVSNSNNPSNRRAFLVVILALQRLGVPPTNLLSLLSAAVSIFFCNSI